MRAAGQGSGSLCPATSFPRGICRPRPGFQAHGGGHRGARGRPRAAVTANALPRLAQAGRRAGRGPCRASSRGADMSPPQKSFRKSKHLGTSLCPSLLPAAGLRGFKQPRWQAGLVWAHVSRDGAGAPQGTRRRPGIQEARDLGPAYMLDSESRSHCPARQHHEALGRAPPRSLSLGAEGSRSQRKHTRSRSSCHSPDTWNEVKGCTQVALQPRRPACRRGSRSPCARLTRLASLWRATEIAVPTCRAAFCVSPPPGHAAWSHVGPACLGAVQCAESPTRARRGGIRDLSVPLRARFLAA